MKVTLFGGSFNPIHYGHIGLAQWVIAHTDTDALWLMVSPNNPLKDRSVLADEQERLSQVRQVIERLQAQEPNEINAKLYASDFEFHLPQPSYTANTLRALSQAYPQHTFRLLIGEDNWANFRRWREWEYLLTHYEIWVYPRQSTKDQGIPTSAYRNTDIPRPLTPSNLEGELWGHTVRYLWEAPRFDISSSEIRGGLKPASYEWR